MLDDLFSLENSKTALGLKVHHCIGSNATKYHYALLDLEYFCNYILGCY